MQSRSSGITIFQDFMPHLDWFRRETLRETVAVTESYQLLIYTEINSRKVIGDSI